jgi:hypothetical protein
MDRWRLVLQEAKEEDERKRLLGVEVEAEEDEFEVGDEVSISVEDDDELDEWKAEDDEDYPSRKKRSKEKKYLLKPDRGSWIAGADDLAKGGLTKGYVGMKEAKKPRKKQCHAYNPFHNDEGKFTSPKREKGSYSMEKPDSDSPDDCTWGQARRSSPSRSTQSTKRPCGRAGKYVCKDGSEKYEEALLAFEGATLTEGDNAQFEAYMSGVISRELERAVKKHMAGSGCSFQQLIRAMTAWSDAEKGSKKS